MKDPCNKCLVFAMCSQICWDKTNYDALLKSNMNYYKRTKYTEDFLKYNKKYQEHRKTLNEIQFRKVRKMRNK